MKVSIMLINLTCNISIPLIPTVKTNSSLYAFTMIQFIPTMISHLSYIISRKQIPQFSFILTFTVKVDKSASTEVAQRYPGVHIEHTVSEVNHVR